MENNIEVLRKRFFDICTTAKSGKVILEEIYSEDPDKLFRFIIDNCTLNSQVSDDEIKEFAKKLLKTKPLHVITKSAFKLGTEMLSMSTETAKWMRSKFISFSSESNEKDGWISFKERQPDIGNEYNVVWDVEDGGLPVSSTMEWDAINKKWIDVIGASTECLTVLYWQPLPNPRNK